jgi:hypothetical protein
VVGCLYATEEIDHVSVVGRNIARLTAGDEVFILDDLTVNPCSSGVAKVGLERRP